MKKLLFVLFVLVMTSCGCGHKDGEHVPNDTILCIVEKKSEDLTYNPVVHMMEYEYNVKFRNLETGKTRTIDKKLFYNMFEQGDTIFEIVQHCPYYRVELAQRK